jgi:hypothetical protein
MLRFTLRTVKEGSRERFIELADIPPDEEGTAAGEEHR